MAPSPYGPIALWSHRSLAPIRFVRSPVPVKPVEYSKTPKNAALAQLYGPVCFKAYEMAARLTRGFIGACVRASVGNWVVW